MDLDTSDLGGFIQDQTNKVLEGFSNIKIPFEVELLAKDFSILTQVADRIRMENKTMLEQLIKDVIPLVLKKHASAYPNPEDVEREILQTAERFNQKKMADMEEEKLIADEEALSKVTYFVVNTNKKNDTKSHEDMLQNQKVAAYGKWKNRIAIINKSDIVFLYESGVGVVAVGTASGKINRSPYPGDPNALEEEYSMTLDPFIQLKTPLSAPEIKRVTGGNHVFFKSLFRMSYKHGKYLHEYILKQPA